MSLIEYIEDFAQDIDFEKLRAEVPFERRSVRVYGKLHEQPRLTFWAGPVAYAYSGLTWEPRPLTGLLEALRGRLEVRLGTPFNSVLANLYRDGSDTVGWHADNEAIFGPDPIVASLSFGTTRTFKLRSVKGRAAQNLSFDLKHGSLLVMGRGVRRTFQHTLPRTKAPIGPRINLTFRLVPGY